MQAAFYFSDDLQSTAANPSCFSNCLQPQKSLQPAPSPVGEGWREGIPRIAAIFPNTLTSQIQTLRFVALSLALSHGREDGVAVGIKGSVRKVGCAGCFFSFQTTFNQRQIQESRSPHVGCVRYARTHAFSIFPATPTHSVRAFLLPPRSFLGAWLWRVDAGRSCRQSIVFRAGSFFYY